jgi:hypothetical protein
MTTPNANFTAARTDAAQTFTGDQVFSDNVGIGATTIGAQNKLHIRYSAVTGATYFASSPLVIERADVNLIAMMSNNGTDQGILFGDAADNDIGGLFYLHTDNKMTFRTNTVTAMTLDSGTTFADYSTLALNHPTTGAVVSLKSNGTTVGQLFNTADTFFVETGGAYTLQFRINAGEKGRFTTGGYFKASNDATYLDVAGSFHEFKNTTQSAGALIAWSSNANFDAVVLGSQASRNTTNNSFYFFSCYNRTATANKLLIADSGDVTNTNGTYAQISDVKNKTDIVDAGSQWADIKGLRFRKFKMKSDPSGLTQLGVIAQEVEQVSPGLVDEHIDRDGDGNDLGTTTKSVKTSVLLMKAAVALQEAMARIEKLESEVAELKGA